MVKHEIRIRNTEIEQHQHIRSARCGPEAARVQCAIWIEGKKMYFTPQADWAVIGAYATLEFRN